MTGSESNVVDVIDKMQLENNQNILKGPCSDIDYSTKIGDVGPVGNGSVIMYIYAYT